MPVLTASLWKATLVFVAAGCVSLVLRRARASVRHMVWVVALGTALAIPAVSPFLPAWPVTLWQDLLPGRELPLFQAESTPAAVPAKELDPPAPSDRASAGPAASPVAGFRMPQLALLWLAGSMLVLIRMALEAGAVVRVRRSGRPARPAVQALARELSVRLGVKRPVRVLESGAATTPMTWGSFRPVIILPTSAVDTPLLPSALVHELTHIKRQDHLLQIMGQVCCALYWFHPLVWVAQREALRWRERAADDRVLRFGVGSADYASQLLEIARSMRAPKLCGSLAMVRVPRLESRVRAILDPRLRRNGLSRGTVAAGVFLAALSALSLSAIRPVLAAIPELPLPPIAVVRAALPETNVSALESEARKLADSFEFDKAAELYRQAAESRKRISGPASTEYAEALERSGGFYRTWDRLKEANDCYQEVLSILERNLGPSHPALFEAVHFLAIEAHSRGDKIAAENLYQRAYDLRKPSGGNEAALALNGLALLADGRGESEKAVKLLEEAELLALPGSSAKWLVLYSKARVLRALGQEADADAAATASATACENWKNAVVAARPEAYTLSPREPSVARVGGGVSAPRLLYKAEPQFSSEARVDKVQGAVVLQAIIEEDGRIRDIRVTRPIGFGLDEQAVSAVRKWQFQPALRDGMPVAVQAAIEVNFRLL